MATVKDKARPWSNLDPHIPNKAYHASMISLADGVTAPATKAGNAYIYTDKVDGDLKVKFGDGTTKVVAADT